MVVAVATEEEGAMEEAAAMVAMVAEVMNIIKVGSDWFSRL